MDLVTILTGTMPALVIVAALLAAIASAFLLWLYRRATLRAMAQKAGGAESSDEPTISTATAGDGGKPLTIRIQPARSTSSAPAASEGSYRRATKALYKAGLAVAAGGAVYALILTIPWMVGTSEDLSVARFLWLFVCYAWPAALAVSLVTTTGNLERLRLAGAYLAVTLAVAVLALSRSSDLTVGQLAFFWIFANGPATLLLTAFLHRRIRAVGPIVLTFMVAGVTGAFLVIEVARANESVLRAFASIGASVGMNAVGAFVLMHAVGFVAFGVLGWQLLRWIGRRYEAKRVSDQSITLDSLWLLFGTVQPITLVFEHWAWIFTGLVAFVACKLTTAAGFALLRAGAPQQSAASRLLLLRVFALGRRSERLFDTLSNWWRRLGGISLIAGPDLVTSAVEPHEFLQFLSGRLSRQFVADEADLDRRIAEIDRQPDPDGRYRVDEFFCHADTWQITMRQLAQQSTAVLMDLRSFSRDNAGCIYELEQLLDSVDLRRVALLVDDTTDTPFLEESLQEAWQRVDLDSPNLAVASPTANLFQATGPSARATGALLRMLAGV